MNKINKISIIIFSLFIVFSNFNLVNAETNINAGIANGVWFSKYPIFEGETFFIKTAFQNNSGNSISGTANFSTEEKEIGEIAFDVSDGKLIELSHEYTADYGNHKFYIQIKTENDLINQTVNSFEIFIDSDTDNDGVGNNDDEDDDNDGIVDDEDDEPLVYNLKRDSNSAATSTADETIEKIQEKTKSFFAGINNFTNGVHYSLESKIEKVQSEIEEINNEKNKKQSGEELVVVTAEDNPDYNISESKNAKYLQIALLASASVLFGNKWLFYIGVFLIIFFVSRFVIRKIIK
jgi:hypothetical protein